MKRVNKIVSIIVLICLLFNTAVSDYSFAQNIDFKPNSDKLAPSSRFDDLNGKIDLQDIARLEMTLEEVAWKAKRADGSIDIKAFIKIDSKMALQLK